eukprot:15434285-Alexandrium_andersonii.AAC.1
MLPGAGAKARAKAKTKASAKGKAKGKAKAKPGPSSPSALQSPNKEHAAMAEPMPADTTDGRPTVLVDDMASAVASVVQSLPAQSVKHDVLDFAISLCLQFALKGSLLVTPLTN